MRRSRRPELDLLVSTVVVEVGVDVPNATLLLVERADRFGLSQLHQLRGRVSRGTVPGQCWLFAAPSTADARARVRRHEFQRPVLRTSCRPRGRPGDARRGPVVVYSCLAIAFVGPRLVDSPPLVSGQPFQARIDFAARRFTWCKVQPPGGEGTGRPGEERQPPAACGGV